MKKIFLLIGFILMTNISILAQDIERVEPPCWWTGMKTKLQLMFYGKNIGDCNVSIVSGNGAVSIAKTYKAESPNYIFVDVNIAENAKPDSYIFEFSNEYRRFTYSYKIGERRANSAQRKSFNSADLIYLINPDRFSDGDTTINSTKYTAEKANRRNPQGRHGGDIQGIINHLDYLQELGVTAIWCTPLLLDNEPTYSYHGYACSNYYMIDPRYGTNDLFCTYVEKAHAHDIKIVMDIVTNHCGTAHWWMRDLPFADWVNQFPTLTRTNAALQTNYDVNASDYDRDLCMRGWFDTSMPDMNLRNPFVLQYFKQFAIWWIEYANLDGLRTDTHPYNDKLAMADWCKGVRQEFPNISIVAECWVSSPAQIAYWNSHVPNKDGFCSNLTSAMDFPLQENICRAFETVASQDFWADGMVKIYNSLTDDFLYDDVNTLMIFLGNHDTKRFGDVVNGNAKYMKLAHALIATMRGIPQLYYGDEMMLRSTNLADGHGGLRCDFPGGWKNDKINLFKAEQRNAEQKDLFNFCKTIFNYRKTSQALQTGRTKHFAARDNTYSYFRYNDNEAVFVYINASHEAKAIDWPKYIEVTKNYAPVAKNIITGENVSINEPLTMAPESVIILSFNK